LGMWSKALGLSDLSTLANVLKGRRTPSTELANRFATYFKFNAVAFRYWEAILEKARLRKTGEWLESLINRQMNSLAVDARKKVIAGSERTSVPILYSIVARELARISNISEDGSSSESTVLLGELDSATLLKAFSTLSSLGELQANEEGLLKPDDTYVDTGEEVSDEQVKHFHEESCDRAKKAIRTFDINERYFSGSVFSLKSEDLPKLKKFCWELESQILGNTASDTPDAIYQLNVHFFPVVKIKK
jgi:uncharacterized protein (TIGR02147 family)